MPVRFSRGFTLIEMALVVIIIGVLMLPLVKTYDNYVISKREKTTKEHIDMVGDLLFRFLSNNGRFPCPANRATAPEAVNAGTEVCAGLPAVGACTPDGGICVVAGERDVDGVAGNDPVVIGALPYKTVSESVDTFYGKDDVADGWGNKLTYAVSMALINAYSDNMGAIRVIDEFGQDTAGIQSDALYVIVAAGRDRKGAFDIQGRQSVPCGNVLDARDNENCDADAVFTQALGQYETDAPTYYDDRVFTYITRSTNLWDYIDPGNPTDIRNTNPGNVGIGTNNPVVRLHVTDGGGASIRAPGKVRTDKICDGVGGNCFDTSTITGTPDAVTTTPDPTTKGIRCATGYVMVGISEGNEDCQKITFTPPPANRECTGATPWLGGLRSNGDIICVP